MDIIIDLKDIVIEFNNYFIGSLTLKNKLYRLLTNKKITAFKAINHLDLGVREGERIGIIGRNGAGKTTLLRVIAGIIVPTKGDVRISKHVIPLLELGIGFHPELSGRENCYLGGALLGFRPKQIRDRIDGIIDFSGIGSFIEAPIKSYSSGMIARLAFALAMEVEPEILLIDEIIGVGDPFFQRKCIVRLQNMMKRGVTTIMVSHNTDFLVAQCNRLIWLEKGKIVMDGLPEQVAESYLNTRGEIV